MASPLQLACKSPLGELRQSLRCALNERSFSPPARLAVPRSCNYLVWVLLHSYANTRYPLSATCCTWGVIWWTWVCFEYTSESCLDGHSLPACFGRRARPPISRGANSRPVHAESAIWRLGPPPMAFDAQGTHVHNQRAGGLFRQV